MAVGSSGTKGKGGSERNKVAESQPASRKGPSQVLKVCGFALDELPLPIALNVGKRGLRGHRVGKEKKGVLCPYRHRQSASFPGHTCSVV